MTTIRYDNRTYRILETHQKARVLPVVENTTTFFIPDTMDFHRGMTHVVEDASGKVIDFQMHPPSLAPLHSKVIPKGTKTIIFHRAEKGLGDLVMTLSAVIGIKKMYPAAKIVYMGQPPLIEVLGEHPGIDLILAANAPKPDGVVIRLGKPCPAAAYEAAKGSEIDRGRIELFNIASGITTPALRPKLYTTAKEDNKALAWLKSNLPAGKKVVGVVLRSAEKWRDYADAKRLAKRLAKRYGVVTIDHQFAIGLPNTVGFSLRQTMAIVKQLDLIITPDTGWLHVAGALGTRILALFGPTDPVYRVTPYGQQHAWLTGNCPYQRMHCWYQICSGTAEIQPCMKFGTKPIIDKTMEMLYG